jgi:hypothetical protein
MKTLNHLIFLLIFISWSSQAQTLDVALREKIDRVSSSKSIDLDKAKLKAVE